MRIIIGKTAGFCYGVKRAIDGVKQQSKENKLFCIGEIVHNKQVIEELQEKGVKFVDDIGEVKNKKSKVAIRAHGVKKEIYEMAKNKKIEIIDYTCPNVLRIHEIAREYANKGFYIILCGKKEHPENIGTISYCGTNYSIIQDEKELREALKKFERTKIDKLLVIAQTTFSVKKFDLIEKVIKIETKDKEDIVIKNTICRATELRPRETEELSKKVDFMIVIGGRNSSNTMKLYEITKNNCKNSICIETANELPIEKITEYEKIGIMAGASTPKESINNVVNRLKEIDNNKILKV